VPIWKGKGDVKDCSNYRPIWLLCHTMKISERVLDARIRTIVDISPKQCGFVKNCGTTDTIHAARLLMERHHEKRKTIHMAFLDLEKAFNRVPHDLILLALRQHHIPEAYVSWTKLLYQKATSSVRCTAGTSDTFPINVGVHQGAALSPLLFILCIDTVTKDIQTRHPWTLLYANDVMIANSLEQQVQEWKTHLERFGMKLNIKKTEYLECGDQTDGTIAAGGVQLNKVTQFKYLGSCVNSDCTTLQDAKISSQRRLDEITSGHWSAVRQEDPLAPKQVYRSVVRLVALFGTECWPTTKKHEQALHTMEMKMLRWTLGLTRLDHVMNEEVRKTLKVDPITEKMRESRLRWYGHVLRSND
uniref:ribonuclease H n=1 Tax=Lepisosteus oculatus TaxID=7918 RepID=W5NIS9_LEPOC